jgi:hypothetical protein
MSNVGHQQSNPVLGHRRHQAALFAGAQASAWSGRAPSRRPGCAAAFGACVQCSLARRHSWRSWGGRCPPRAWRSSRCLPRSRSLQCAHAAAVWFSALAAAQPINQPDSQRRVTSVRFCLRTAAVVCRLSQTLGLLERYATTSTRLCHRSSR